MDTFFRQPHLEYFVYVPLVYFAIGIVVSFVNWFLYCRRIAKWVQQGSSELEASDEKVMKSDIMTQIHIDTSISAQARQVDLELAMPKLIKAYKLFSVLDRAGDYRSVYGELYRMPYLYFFTLGPASPHRLLDKAESSLALCIPPVPSRGLRIILFAIIFWPVVIVTPVVYKSYEFIYLPIANRCLCVYSALARFAFNK